ncbi:MAG: glycosyltransferase [Candidatus Heimdallarchaeaceae archaeon]
MVSRHHKLFWGSSYDRGLQYLLYMWPDIKQAYPDAELHITYGWDLFLKVATGNPERMKWKASMDKLLQQKGIFHYGRVGKEELKKIRSACGIWAYPTDFQEINCITALDCQKDGVVPVTMNYAALKETVKYGIKVEGNIREIDVQQKYLKELVLLMGDKKRWKELSLKGKKFAKKFYWNKIADQWIEVFKKKTSNPKVSVITPTIRTGWWRIMAENLSQQTYKNFEWIIVDDFGKDRRLISEKYAKEYNLNIKYLRGDKVTRYYKRKLGLVRANNKAWQNASGELLVWLQDFIIIPKNGLEMLVDLHRHNTDALLAPVDIYYNSKKTNLKNEEDWWDGKKNIITKENWRNIRVKNQGIRETDNPFDFETNYGAIPKKILDKLNGFWEFMDDGLGYDNTEIAMRAIKLGYRIIIDDTNIAKCINLWPMIKGKPQNITNRERILNTPRFRWLRGKMATGELPIIRDEKKDDSIQLDFTVPKEVKNKDASKWINQNARKILIGWGEGDLDARSF